MASLPPNLTTGWLGAPLSLCERGVRCSRAMTRFRRLGNFAFQVIVFLLLCGILPSLVLAQGIPLTPQQWARAHGQLPLTSFYETPVPLPAGKPGDLIRSQAFDDYDLPDGISAIRILYHSVAATGADVASSAVVLIPRGSAPKGGWPILAWAHPFVGVARLCAPSLMRGLGVNSG